MWKKVKLPFLFERMVAFSIPSQQKVWILTHDRLFEMHLASEITITEVLRNAQELEQLWKDIWADLPLTGDFFCEARSLLSLSGQSIPMLGLYGGVPLLHNARGEQLSLEPIAERLMILTDDFQVQQIIEFSDCSGDWRWATFSSDGQHLLIGTPSDLFVYQWLPD